MLKNRITMSFGKNKYLAWDYSVRSDILNIHKTGKKTEGNAELGDFTVDFDKNGKISGCGRGVNLCLQLK